MGAFDAHKNLAYSTVATAPSPALSGTSLVVAAGQGSRFPAAPFNATVWPANQIPTPANSEIVRITAIATDTFTITRTTESTSARSISVGDQIAATITAKTLTDVENVALWVEQSTANTGTQNDFDLSGPKTYLRCTGAAPSFSGFTVNGAAPYAGCQVLIECLGTTAKVTNQDAGSTAANRLITPSSTGQIIGVNGLMLCVYDATTSRWREHLIDPGAPIAVTFSAGDFTGNGSMTVTLQSGDVDTFTYVQWGKTVFINVALSTITIGGTPSTIVQVAIPGGFTVTKKVVTIGLSGDNGTYQATWVDVQASGTVIRFFKDPAGNAWSASTNNSGVYAMIEFEVN